MACVARYVDEVVQFDELGASLSRLIPTWPCGALLLYFLARILLVGLGEDFE